MKIERTKRIFSHRGHRGTEIVIEPLRREGPQYHLLELRGRFRITTEPSPDGREYDSNEGHPTILLSRKRSGVRAFFLIYNGDVALPPASGS